MILDQAWLASVSRGFEPPSARPTRPAPNHPIRRYHVGQTRSRRDGQPVSQEPPPAQPESSMVDLPIQGATASATPQTCCQSPAHVRGTPCQNADLATSVSPRPKKQDGRPSPAARLTLPHPLSCTAVRRVGIEPTTCRPVTIAVRRGNAAAAARAGVAPRPRSGRSARRSELVGGNQGRRAAQPGEDPPLASEIRPRGRIGAIGIPGNEGQHRPRSARRTPTLEPPLRAGDGVEALLKRHGQTPIQRVLDHLVFQALHTRHHRGQLPGALER